MRRSPSFGRDAPFLRMGSIQGVGTLRTAVSSAPARVMMRTATSPFSGAANGWVFALRQLYQCAGSSCAPSRAFNRLSLRSSLWPGKWMPRAKNAEPS